MLADHIKDTPSLKFYIPHSDFRYLMKVPDGFSFLVPVFALSPESHCVVPQCISIVTLQQVQPTGEVVWAA